MRPGTPQPGDRHPTPGSRAPAATTSSDADFAHRTRTNTRTPLEPIGYDSEGAPLWPWQLYDSD